MEAAVAIGFSDQFIKGAVEDYEKLLRLDIGSFTQAGKPIDPAARRTAQTGQRGVSSNRLTAIGGTSHTTTGTVSGCHAQ